MMYISYYFMVGAILVIWLSIVHWNQKDIATRENMRLRKTQILVFLFWPLLMAMEAWLIYREK